MGYSDRFAYIYIYIVLGKSVFNVLKTYRMFLNRLFRGNRLIYDDEKTGRNDWIDFHSI